jgi:hypothetical protein
MEIWMLIRTKSMVLNKTDKKIPKSVKRRKKITIRKNKILKRKLHKSSESKA